MSAQIRAEIPEAFEFLFQPARYKVAFGGRGSAKSWAFARALLIQATSRSLRILCAREIQRSIAESVHRLLAQQIDAMGLSRVWDVQQALIRGPGGSEVLFAGLKHNVTNIKSLEGVDVCWVEEAHAVSRESWSVLIPTIRKPDSEIWVSFNPELEEDDTYKRFVVSPPPGAIVRKVSHADNPWFPDTLKREMDHLRETDEAQYLTVYEGHCRTVLEGAIYAKQMVEAVNDSRITRVPVDRTKPVSTFWDLGRADKTVIWMAQQVGFEFRLVDYIEGRGEDLGHYLRELNRRPYLWGTDWLPHDAGARLLGAARTIAEQVADAGRRAMIVPKIGVAEGIEAARAIFPRCWFDAEKCAEGILSLKRYRFDVDPDTKKYSNRPLHDEHSHAADAFRYFAVSMADRRPEPRARSSGGGTAQGWMG